MVSFLISFASIALLSMTANCDADTALSAFGEVPLSPLLPKQRRKALGVPSNAEVMAALYKREKEQDKLTPLKGMVSCEGCQHFLNHAIQFVEADNTRAAQQYAEQHCDATYTNGANSILSREGCRVLYSLLPEILPQLVSLAQYINWDISRNTCALFYKVCDMPCCTVGSAFEGYSTNPNKKTYKESIKQISGIESHRNQPTPLKYLPEQLRLNWPKTYDQSEVTITWVTLEASGHPYVEYWQGNDDYVLSASQSTDNVGQSPHKVAKATTSTYHHGGWVGTLYTATMTDLKPDTAYSYFVGGHGSKNHPSQSQHIQSEIYTFFTLPTNIGTKLRPLRILSLGDMDWSPISNHTARRLKERVMSREVDFVIHNGDMSYDDGQFNHWDVYNRKVQDYTARIVTMTTPGNHEFWYNFSVYTKRLGVNMPQVPGQLPGSLHYPLSIGPVEFLFMNSESWIDTAEVKPSQVAWAKDHIKHVDREAKPWVIAVVHRPLYCSSTSSDDSLDCDISSVYMRAALERAFIDNKLDIAFQAHIHSSQRTYPLKYGKAQATNGNKSHFRNPKAPVYITNGAAGNHESNTVPREGSEFAWGSSAIGYGIMTIYSEGHHHYFNHQLFDSATNKLIDDFTITKD